MDPIVALATEDGLHWPEGHFGDAAFYELYRLDEGGAVYVGRVVNTAEEETTHGDPRKAQRITDLLKAHGVHALVAPRFGPNIARIRSHFVPVVISAPTLQDALATLPAIRSQIVAEWKRAGMRKTAIVR